MAEPAPGAHAAMQLVWSGCVGTVAISPQRLFESLDGRIVTVSGRQWRVVVYSVCEVGDSTWLQLTLEGSPTLSLMLQTKPDSSPKRAVTLLSSWLADPGATGNVVQG